MKNTFHITEEVRESIKKIQELYFKQTGVNLSPDKVVAISIKNTETVLKLKEDQKK